MALQQQIQDTVTQFERAREKLQTQRKMLSELLAQQQENEQVIKELEIIEDDAIIYKKIGTVLVKQPKDDAKNVVSKRLSYIRSEIERVEKFYNQLQSQCAELAGKVETLKIQVIEATAAQQKVKT